MRDALVVAGGYALGSIPFALLVTRAAGLGDLRRLGSGSLGATNTLRVAGWAPGLIVLALDAGKGALAVWVARRAGAADPVVVLSGCAAIAGHVAPVWLGFRGGKGVAAATGVFAMLAPRALLCAALVFVVVVAATRYVSLGSILAAVALAVAAGLIEPPLVALAAVTVAASIVVLHRANLARLRAGTEYKLGARV